MLPTPARRPFPALLSAAAITVALLAEAPLAAQDRPDARPTDVLTLARDAGNFATLLAAVDAAGLADTLRGAGPFTVLAPTDAAFRALPDGALDGLLADPTRLAAVLQAHVVAGARTATDLVTAGSCEALDGSRWAIAIDGGQLTVGGARATGTDLRAANGIVHVLDRVLLPAAAQTGPAQTGPAVEYTAAEARAMRDERTAAADALEAALDAGADAPALADAAERAAALLGRHPASRARLADAARAARDGGEKSVLERAVEQAVGDLRFRPYVEAELPLGWPDTAPVGEVVLKTYPRYRMAQTTMSARGGTTTPFFALFNHIKRNDIAMTAPVQMDFDGDAEVRRAASMAFLYAHPEQGESGADARDERVEVVDVAPSMAVSIGGRGYEQPQQTDAMKARLTAWLAAHAAEFEAAGPMRTMGYNSPMVPGPRRFFEVELPVRRIRPTGN